MSYEPGPYTSSKDKSTTPPATTKPTQYDTLPDVIGGPPTPGTNVIPTENMMLNSSLQIKIYPCKPKMQSGLSLFILDSQNGWDHYVELLNQINYTPSELQKEQHGITVLCQAESFPTDSFQNEYGESFLNQITDVAAGGFGQLAQMFGKEDAIQSGNAIAKLLKEYGGISSAVGNAIGSASTGAENLVNKWKQEGGLKGSTADLMSKLLAGARIDFPMIWKGSSYNPTFSCTVKLYNPSPGSRKMTEQYIVAPLAALLTLALPQSVDDNAYNYPLFCRVSCPGLFKIQAGAISNITVTKGGEAGLVGFNQRLAMVDVRIDFINLHSTLILSKSGTETRPTLKGYLENLKDEVEVEPIYNTNKLNIFEEIMNYVASPSVTTDTTEQPPSRVDQEKVSSESDLVANNPGFYNPSTPT